MALHTYEDLNYMRTKTYLLNSATWRPHWLWEELFTMMREAKVDWLGEWPACRKRSPQVWAMPHFPCQLLLPDHYYSLVGVRSSCPYSLIKRSLSPPRVTLLGALLEVFHYLLKITLTFDGMTLIGFHSNGDKYGYLFVHSVSILFVRRLNIG